MDPVVVLVTFKSTLTKVSQQLIYILSLMLTNLELHGPILHFV